MTSTGLKLSVAAGALTGMLAAGAANADALSTPAMSGPLAANPNPYSVDLPDWLGDAGGKVYVTGAVSGLAYYESSPNHTVPGDTSSYLDISNGQVFIQKTDGWLQFYVQAGAYSFPTVGVPYTKASTTTQGSLGFVPVAYLKLQGQGQLADFSVQAGKLPTLIGDEYSFTFQNMNIERGLLWNLEPVVSRGVQINYTHGPLTISGSWNDGTYSKVFSSLSGLISYGFNGGSDTVAFAGGGSIASNWHANLLNSGSYYDLIYTHTSGPWTISPYIQFIDIPSFSGVPSTQVWGGALLASYSLNDNWKVAGRVEYEGATGGAAAANIIGYGGGSNAWSLTVTPTYQWKVFFARADVSYVSAGSVTAGDAFGTTGTNTDQVRVMFETGILF